MTSSKKNSKSIIALVVMSFLLVASIVLAATGAWFTSAARQHSSLTFGTVEINAMTPGNDGLVSATSHTTTNTNLLMPDDTLEINFTVDYAGTANAYMLAKVEVGITGNGSGDANAITGLSGWYVIRDLAAAVGGTPAETVLSAAKATTTAGVVSASTASENLIPVNIQVALTGANYGNDFQGAVITVKVSLYALQEENITAAQAYNYITKAANNADLEEGDTGYSSSNDDLNVNLVDNGSWAA